ncbi:CG3597 [Drosophila busckii]|uniref:Trans-1,2-dihydrobenzene-1,2-diol dehydrogenase n=2 Tax=Drosophila busckii TaxID=30019 RepID=A0A0M3QTZ7_DROBS|nr:CG3597 [Drosophila busckii]
MRTPSKNNTAANAEKQKLQREPKEQPPELIEKTLRWGIASLGHLADDFVAALNVLPPGQHCISSCLSAQRSQAYSFALKHNVPNVYTSFEQLARCPHVDIVYICPQGLRHCELCHLMLNHDKHVLCEPPLASTELRVAELGQKAQSRGLFLMEGIWSRCLPAYHYLRRQITSKRLGNICMVYCTLGLHDQLLSKNLTTAGIQLALWVYREVPTLVRVSNKLRDHKDVLAQVDLFFNRSRRARLILSAEPQRKSTAHIYGTKDSITLHDFHSPTQLSCQHTDVEFVSPQSNQRTHYLNRINMCYELQQVRNCIHQGQPQSELFSHSESQLLAHLLNQVQELLGISFEEIDAKLSVAQLPKAAQALGLNQLGLTRKQVKRLQRMPSWIW